MGFNTFAIFILSFVAQLEDHPTRVLQEVEITLRRVAKGPGKWASPKDLWTLKEAFGLQASFQNLEWIARAAKFRVLYADPACRPSHRFWDEAAKVRRIIACPGDGFVNWRWRSWYENSFALTLSRAHEEVIRICGSIEAVKATRIATPRPAQAERIWKQKCQSTFYAILLASSLDDPKNSLAQTLQVESP